MARVNTKRLDTISGNGVNKVSSTLAPLTIAAAQFFYYNTPLGICQVFFANFTKNLQFLKLKKNKKILKKLLTNALFNGIIIM